MDESGALFRVTWAASRTWNMHLSNLDRRGRRIIAGAGVPWGVLLCPGNDLSHSKDSVYLRER